MLDINESNFVENTSKGLVLVDFYATWCPPCKAIAPVLETLQNIKVVKVNVDENTELAIQYRVSSIPLLVFLKDGNEVDRLSGVQSYATLQGKADYLNESIV